MFIRAYLRASTQEQNAERARESLVQFAANHGQRIAAFYVENVSGATLHRPELMKLIADSGEGDIVLVEQIDRLARLKQSTGTPSSKSWPPSGWPSSPRNYQPVGSPWKRKTIPDSQTPFSGRSTP